MPVLPASHPGFFQVLATPRAYTALAYLLLSLPLGVLAFTFAVTGLSLSLGLAILIVGVPVLVGFLGLARALSVAEVHLLRTLVGPELLSAPPLLPRGEGFFERLKTLLTDRHTWTSLAYFLLQLPLGVAGFTLMVCGLVLGLALLAAPVAALFHGPAYFSLEGLPWLERHSGIGMLVSGAAGVLLLPLTFHAALVLGRFQAWLAHHLLIRE